MGRRPREVHLAQTAGLCRLERLERRDVLPEFRFSPEVSLGCGSCSTKVGMNIRASLDEGSQYRSRFGTQQ